jgi:hypothetical protein
VNFIKILNIVAWLNFKKIRNFNIKILIKK